MKNLFYLFFFIFSFTQAQIPSVTISDHHGTEDSIQIDCDYEFLPNKSIRLEANYPIIRQSTKYTVESIPHEPEAPYSAGNLINIEGHNGKKDDVFGDIISLPFEFCYYGNKFNNLIISDNGVVSFDTTNANGDCAYIPSGTIPNTGLPKNAIFGVYHDLQNTDEVKILTQGTAPYRQFIINYNNILQFGTDSYRSTSQIVLYETTNQIKVFVEKKPLNPSSTIENTRKQSVIGLTNQNGSIGIAPPNRNTGNWEITESEGWAFVPDGASSINIQWYNGNSYIGNSNPITVSPTTDVQYRVVVTYNLCSPITVEDTIDVKFSQDFPTAHDLDITICVDQGETAVVDLTSYENEINSETSLTFTYHTSQAGANNNTNLISNPTNYTFSSNDHYVYVRTLKSGICYSVSKIRLRINRKPNIPNDLEFPFCDDLNDNKETVNLNSLNISGINYQFIRKFYPTENDAIANTNPIVNVTNYLLQPPPPSQTVTIYLKTWNTYFGDESCYIIVPITLRLKPYVETKEHEELICFVTVGQTITLDLTQFQDNLLVSPTPNATFTFYRNANTTNAGLITDPTTALVTMNATFYVKISIPNYCDSIAELKITADDDCDGSPGDGGGGGSGGGGVGARCNVSFPFEVNLIHDYFQYYLPNSLTLNDVTVNGFYSDPALTQAVPNPYEITNTGTTTIYTSYTINATSVTTSLSFPITASSEAILDDNEFDICDLHNDQTEFVNLSEIILPIFQNLYNPASIYFFTSVSEVNDFIADQNSVNPINSITITQPTTTIYVLVRFFDCWYRHEIYLNLIPVEEKLIELTICDFNDDQQENINLDNYLTDIHALLSQEQIDNLVTIYFYLNSNQAHLGTPGTQITNTNSFNINASQMSVFVRLNILDECPIIVELQFTFSTSINLPEIDENAVNVCDLSDDGEEVTNLNAIFNSFDPNSTIDFYSSQNGAENQDPNFHIGSFIDGNILNYTITSNLTIYIRVYDTVSGCINVFPITFNLISIPRLNDNKIEICDVENDDLETVSIDTIKNELINNNSSILNQNMTFILYENQADALAGINDITEITINNTTTAWVSISSDSANCSDIFEIIFALIPSPELNNISIQICNNNTKNNNHEISENINLNDYRNQILGFPYSSEFSFSYYLSEMNAQNGTSAISDSYNITSFPQTIFVRVVNSLTGCFSVASLTIDELPAFEVTPTEIKFCSEGELNGIVNLNDYASQMVDDVSNYTFSFHDNKNNAISDIPVSEDITSFYVTPTTEIWIKIIDNINGCFVLSKLSVSIYPSPKMNPVFIDQCDDNLDDEFNYDLNQYKNQWITGEPNVESLFDFQYFTNLSDAESGNNPINADLTFSYSEMVPSTSPNSLEFTIYVRATNSDETACASISTITFKTNKKTPLLQNEFTLYTCELNPNQGLGVFDLTESNLELSTTANFTYYSTLTDAQNQINEITNFTSYQNLNPFNDTVYVRVYENDFCDNLAQIHLVVQPFLEIENYLAEPICEFNELGEINTVNLNDYISIITENVDPNIVSTTSISFYESLIDAENQTNPLTEVNNYHFPVGTKIVYVRFEQEVTNCFIITEITLTKLPAPIVHNISKSICDEDFDGIILINLQEYFSEISSQSNVSITFHFSNEDAWNGENVIDDNLPFDLNNPTILWAKTVDNQTGCVNVSKIELNIEEIIIPNFDFITQHCAGSIIPDLPIISENGITGTWSPIINNQNTTTYTFTPDAGQCAKPITKTIEILEPIELNSLDPISLCDEDFDGLFTYDLTYLNSALTNLNNINFEYYSTFNDFENQNPISSSDVNNYVFASLPSSIWVVAINQNNCPTQPIEVKFIQGELLDLLPAPYEVNFCPAIPINLIHHQNLLTNENNVQFKYFHSINDAENLTNEISNIQNYSPISSETIYVRLSKNGYCTEIVELNLIESPAINHNNSPGILTNQCDEDSFDLTIFESSIGNENNINFTYFETLTDAQNQINYIQNPFNFSPNTSNGNIFARLDKEGRCPIIVPIEFKKSITPNLEVSDQLLICDEPLEIEAYSDDPNATFVWYWGDNQSATGPNLTVTQTGNYTVVVTNESGCSQEKVVTVSSTGQPHIYLVEAGRDYIIVHANPSQGGNLEYSLNGIFWQNSSRFNNLVKGQTYTVYVREANCKIEMYKVTLLDIPNFISPNNDGYNDTWKIRGVEATPEATLKIFDRYGKMFVDTNFKGNFEWNGMYLGRVVPSSDYWYIIHIPAHGKVKETKYVGHLTVRNHDRP